MRLRIDKLKWRRFTRMPIALEIALALLIKVSLLTLLWNAFFSAPQTKKMRLPTPQVEQHFLTAAPPAAPSLPPTHHEDRHASR